MKEDKKKSFFENRWAGFVILGGNLAVLYGLEYFFPDMNPGLMRVLCWVDMAVMFVLVCVFAFKRTKAGARQQAEIDAQVQEALDAMDEMDAQSEFPFLRLLNEKNRLYLAFETNSWYALLYQTWAAAPQDVLVEPSFFPADADRDQAGKRDIWLAKKDLRRRTIDLRPNAALQWKNCGTVTLEMADKKLTFTVLGGKSYEQLESFFSGAYQ